ncbi:phosphotransferase [Bacillus sp. 165]|uniref:phosphotransferase family protein n=1 Tax=Bacillus sp. 165 TaxID=1529117 RepID=UPI0032AFE128
MKKRFIFWRELINLYRVLFLNPATILWDAMGNTITGVIDFGGAGLGDPAYDFAGLLSYDEEFFTMIAEEYSGIDHMVTRMHFYKSTFALQEALFGIENDDLQAFENGIKGYR